MSEQPTMTDAERKAIVRAIARRAQTSVSATVALLNSPVTHKTPLAIEIIRLGAEHGYIRPDGTAIGAPKQVEDAPAKTVQDVGIATGRTASVVTSMLTRPHEYRREDVLAVARAAAEAGVTVPGQCVTADAETLPAVTPRDVARAAKVPLNTVLRALRGKLEYDDPASALVQRAAEQLAFRPDIFSIDRVPMHGGRALTD